MVKNTTFQPGRSWGEADLVTQKHQNMPKIGCFWPFSHFSCFWDPLFSHLEPKNPNFVHQMLDKISQMIWIGHFWTQKETLNFDQKRNCPVSNARCPGPPGPRGQFFTSTGEIFGSLPISPRIIPLVIQICWPILRRDQTYLAKNITHLCCF